MIEARAMRVPAEAGRRWRQAFRPLVRNRLVLAGALIGALMIGTAVFAELIGRYDPLDQQVLEDLKAPSGEHWFGTDRFGRDVFSRTVHGSRISLGIGFASVGISLTVGTLLGLVSGYYGKWVDNLIGRIMDVFFSFPPLLLAIAVAAMLGPGLTSALLAIAVVYSPLFSRVVRGPVLAERHKEYIEAAHAIGAPTARIITRHLLPNILSPIVVQASVTLSHAILIESYLSYLGLGTQPPAPSWGTMLNEGRTFLEVAPWLSIFPGAAIMLAVLAFNLLGDGLRDVLDPRERSF